ncbi:MAG: hypothetical protein RJB37_2779, partial [Pseudomonadota bacterium]
SGQSWGQAARTTRRVESAEAFMPE